MRRMETNDEPRQDLLFSEEDLIPWRREWRDMPEYSLEDLSPKYSLIVNFSCAADVEDFGALLGQKVRPAQGRQMQSIWYPDQEIGRMVNKRYIDAGGDE